MIREILRRIPDHDRTSCRENPKRNRRQPRDPEAIRIPVASCRNARLKDRDRNIRQRSREARHSENRQPRRLDQPRDRLRRDATIRGCGGDPLSYLLLRDLTEDGRKDDGADGSAYGAKCPDETDGDTEVALRDVERGDGVAVQRDPAKGQHGEELHGHEPVDVCGGAERCEPEEESLHEVGEC